MNRRFLFRFVLLLGNVLLLKIPSAFSESTEVNPFFNPSFKKDLAANTIQPLPENQSKAGVIIIDYDNGNQMFFVSALGEGKEEVSKFFDQDGSLACEIIYLQDQLLDKDGKPFNGRYECRDSSNNLRIESDFNEGIVNGSLRVFLKEGTLYFDQKYKDGQLDGLSKFYYENGDPKHEATFLKDSYEGESSLYYPNGHLWMRLTYHKGKPQGPVAIYYPTGALYYEGLAQEGGPTEGQVYYPDHKLCISLKAPVDSNIQKSIEYYDEKGEKLQSISQYDEAIKKESASLANLYYKRALRYMFEGNYNEALFDFTQAIQKDPDNFYALYHRGRINFQRKQYSAAIEDLVKTKGSLSLDYGIHDTITQAYHYRGLDYSEQKKYDKAISDYSWIIQNAPDYVSLFRIYNNRGNAYLDEKENEKAIEDYSRAIGINHYYRAYYNRGIAYKNLGRIGESISDYKKAIVLRSDYFDAYMNLGNIYRDQKKYDLALEQYNRVLRMDRTHSHAYVGIANVYSDQGLFDKAVEELEIASAIIPNDEMIQYNSGNTLRQKKDWDKALIAYNKAIDLDPKFIDAYINRGLLHEDKEQWDEAMKDYRKAIEIDSKMVRPYSRLGFILLNKNELDQAEIALDKAYDLDPQNVENLSTLGMLHVLRGNANNQNTNEYLKAVDYFSKAISLDTKAFDLFNNRASVYLNLKEYDKAWNDVHRIKALGEQPNPTMLQMLQTKSGRTD